MKKNPKQLSFWKKIRFKYKLSFLNENTLEEVFAIRVSRLSFFLYLLAFAAILITLTAIVIINTPIRNYLPGYLDSEIRRDMIENALKVDSLQQALEMQSHYLNSIHKIISDSNSVDSPPRVDSLANSEDIRLDKTERTAEFVRQYEEEEKYNLNMINAPAVGIPNDMFFYKPSSGIISSKFDASKKHFGVDIAALPNESVLSTTRGTVVFCGFDANAGYVIQIQHANGFVSIYKHNAALLKKEGETVESGEAVALAGSTGELSSGTHLHFELWRNGVPVNPEEFIVF